MKPLVYISSPYSKGDPAINTRFQCQIWNELYSSDLVLPVAPLWSHFQHLTFPRHYEDWMDYDLDLIRAVKFDACLRLDSEVPEIGYKVTKSSGADREVALFHEMGVPVYFSVNSLLDAVRFGRFESEQVEYYKNLLYFPE